VFAVWTSGCGYCRRTPPGEECVPVVLPFSDEDPQVLFQFLVDPFHPSVSLQVVGSRCRSLDS